MRIRKGAFSFKEIFAFLLPSATILTQWFSILGINISWLLYIAVFMLLANRLHRIINHVGILLIAAAVVVVPFCNCFIGIADAFQFSLYFSLITGMSMMLFICTMDSEEYLAFMRGVLFSCMLFTVWGIYEVFTGHYLLFSNQSLFVENWVGLHYPGVAFANTNDLVQYLVLLFPCAGYYLLKSSKVFYVIVTTAIFFVIFQASSKLGMIAFCLLLLMTYVVNMLLQKKGNKVARLLLVGGIVLVALWILELWTGVVGQIFRGFLVVDTEADYFVGRNDLYEDLLSFGLTHPLGAFGSAYSVSETVPHNLFLYVLCDFGWLAAILLACILVRMAVFTFRQIKTQEEKTFWAFLFASVCLFAITSSISSCNEQRKALWLFLAICVRNIYVSPFDNSEPLRSQRIKLIWSESTR